MTLAELIDGLARPCAFPFAVDTVEVRQTHISAVFLAGDVVYKLKKPVNLGFVDFRTLARRRHFCEEEVRLNRRLAPHVYEGVVPVAQTAQGPRFEAEGSVIDWAVKMRRLPDAATLEAHVARGDVDAAALRRLAERLARFYATAHAGPPVARCAFFDRVVELMLGNFGPTQKHVGQTLSAAVFERIERRTRDELERLRPLISTRAARGVPRDTHGDLHLDHVYHFPERSGDEEWVIVDCIEFNEALRYADPVADIAFLVMDVAFHGRWDLAHTFAGAYFDAAGDREGAELLPLYASYRAAVRGKVDGFLVDEAEVPPEAKAAALARGRARWLAALAWLEPADKRPMIVLVGGLPGTGKSTVARHLAERASLTLLRSDVVRKELAGVSAITALAESHYSSAWDDRIYAEMQARAERILWQGGRVVVDATFRSEPRRRQFHELAIAGGVPIVFLECQASPEIVRTRLETRRGDASDAGWDVHERLARTWDPAGPETQRIVRPLRCDGPAEAVTEVALAILQNA